MIDFLQEKMSIVFVAAQRMLKYLPQKDIMPDDRNVSKTAGIAKTKVPVVGPAGLLVC